MLLGKYNHAKYIFNIMYNQLLNKINKNQIFHKWEYLNFKHLNCYYRTRYSPIMYTPTYTNQILFRTFQHITIALFDCVIEDDADGREAHLSL